MAADTTVLALPGGTLNSQQSQGLLASALGPPAAEVAAGAMLVTVSSVQQTLATWLASIVARNKASMLLQWVTGAVVSNDTVYFVYSAPYAGTLNSLTSFAGVGSFTVAVQINGTPVTGLGAVSVASATPATTAATGANTFAAGAIISGVITSASGSPTDAVLSLAATWS